MRWYTSTASAMVASLPVRVGWARSSSPARGAWGRREGIGPFWRTPPRVSGRTPPRTPYPWPHGTHRGDRFGRLRHHHGLPGRFGDHILPEKTHLINVSFLVNRLERRRGGTAANIAYTLALLGERPLLCAAVGSDFTEYGASLSRTGVDTSAALGCDDVPTASCFITTDLDDNQITAFFPGAMARAADIDLRALEDVEHVVVAPDSPDGMARHIAQAREMGARLVFAPAQQIPSIGDETLLAGLDAAWLVVGNDYELELVRNRTGRYVGRAGPEVDRGPDPGRPRQPAPRRG